MKKASLVTDKVRKIHLSRLRLLRWIFTYLIRHLWCLYPKSRVRIFLYPPARPFRKVTLLYHRDVIHESSEKPIYHMWYIGQYVTCGILANMSHVVYWHNIKSIYHMWYIGQYVTCGILVFRKFFPNARWVLSEGRNKNFIMQINPCEQKSFYEKNRFVSQKSPKTSFSRPNTVIYIGVLL